jgi:hypothetical protein
MPTIHREGGYSFRFYSNENNESAHIHLVGKGGEMKVWLADLSISRVKGIPDHEQTKLLEIVETNREKFLQAWNEFRQREK